MSDTGRANFKTDTSNSNENVGNRVIPILHSDLVHLTILEDRNFFLDEIGHVYLKIDGLTYVDITSNEIKKVEKDDIFLDQFVHKVKAQFVL